MSFHFLNTNIGILLALQVLALLILIIPNSRIRRSIAAGLLLCFAVKAGLVIGSNLSWRMFAFSYFSFYQLINITRVVENRLVLPRLRRQVLRSGIVFMACTTAGLLLNESSVLSNKNLPHYLAYIIFGAAIAVLGVTIMHLSRSRFKKSAQFYSDEELPTISVLIPARNEDASLSDCVYSVLKNDYPKLEIIVLDDCSQDSSSDIVKRFAHDGVRFIQGDAPRAQWLAKNQAYDSLAAAASGDWLLFMGVDVRLGEATLRSLISQALNKNRKMISVMPKRLSSSKPAEALAPLRYWWEMAIPRSIFGHPSVLSTCWIIEKKSYLKIGGVAALAQTIIPESYLARELNKKHQYEFMRSSSEVNVMTFKGLRDQYETAVRTRYPQLHRHLEYLAFTTLIMIFLWFLPFLGISYAIVQNDLTLLLLFSVTSICLVLSHVLITGATNPQAIPFSVFNLPYLLLQEMALFNLSMYKYEFSEVTWKGRNICYPVMHVTPRLPDV